MVNAPPAEALDEALNWVIDQCAEAKMDAVGFGLATALQAWVARPEALTLEQFGALVAEWTSIWRATDRRVLDPSRGDARDTSVDMEGTK